MGFKDLALNTIWRIDLLSASPTFRTRKQPAYETVFGGLLSVIVLGVFYYFLYYEMNLMLNNMTITYSQGVEEDVGS
jgi:hypothetical protein